jgi:thiamine-monophosphate kinase
MKEFVFIDLLKKHSPAPPEGVGDDAALLGEFLITTDILTEFVHFLPSEAPADIADRLFQASLSDIAAMGGSSAGYFAILGVGGKKFISQEFAQIVTTLCDTYKIKLIGGDTVASETPFLSLTLIGRRGKNVLRRGGAKAGDLLYLSREIGGAKYALEKRLAGENFQLPRPAERKLGDLLGQTEGITACIDISDGLGRDLSHIAEASKVMIKVESENLPLWAGVSAEYAIDSGEEYALAFTVRPDCAKNLPQGLFFIGYVMEGFGIYMDGLDISQKGYEHGNQ